MAVEDPPFVLQSDSHPAVVFRHAAAAFMGSPVGSFAGGVQATTAGGGHGITAPASYAVSQSGTPGMSVVVSSGLAAVRGTQAASQGCYTVFNDADVTLTIATADGTNPRNDLICLQVRDAAYSGAVNDARLVVVQGTPAASPSDPSLSGTANALVLARVRVNALATSITNGNITDLRTHAYAHGGLAVCTSTTRPSGASLYAGLMAYETDTGRALVYNGANWTGLRTGRFRQDGTGATTSGTVELTGATLVVADQGVAGVLRLTGQVAITQTVATDVFRLRIYDGTPTKIGEAVISPAAVTGGTLTAEVAMSAGSGMTCTLRLVRTAGTGTATTFTDATQHSLYGTFIPNA